MKAEFCGKAKNQAGLSTLEMLIAMTVLLMSLTAAVVVSFAGQSLLADSQASSEALNKAQELLETAQAKARKDFKLVNPSPAFVDSEYTQSLSVEASDDFFTKKLTARVSWLREGNRNLSVQLSALVTNFENAVGGDTCSSVLTGDWTSPRIKNLGNTDFGQMVGDPGGIYPLTGLDAYQGKLYVTVNNTAINNKETFFVFDAANQSGPSLLSKVDNSGVSAGLGAVAVDGKYAYAANAHGASFTTCQQSESCSQLQIFDIQANPPQVKTSFKIPGITGTGGQATGKSVFYRDGYLYLGLAKTKTGPEFNIIDVRNPSNPVWVGGWPMKNTVNAIYVKSGLAYLASPNNQELIILDVSDPVHPAQVGGFDASGSSGNGKSVYAVGDKVYLGRTIGGIEFYILDSVQPAMSPLPILGSKADVDASINGLFVRDFLAFLLTNSDLRILKIDDPINMSSYALPLVLPASGGAEKPAFDCEGNYFFISSNSQSNRGALFVIAP